MVGQGWDTPHISTPFFLEFHTGVLVLKVREGDVARTLPAAVLLLRRDIQLGEPPCVVVREQLCHALKGAQSEVIRAI